MASVRKSVYSLLKPRKRKSDEVNILGYFSPLQEDCELYSLLKSAGVKTIRELSRCDTFEEYEKMSQANFLLYSMRKQDMPPSKWSRSLTYLL